MKIILLSVFVLILSACTSLEGKREWVCNCNERGKLIEFIRSSIEAANNKSDEEMEDVIHQLYLTGVKLHCKSKIIFIDSKGEYILDSCDVVMDGQKDYL